MRRWRRRERCAPGFRSDCSLARPVKTENMDEDAKRRESAGEGGARSVTRALRMLHEVASREAGVTLSDVARSVELPVTTTARLLKTLEQAGFLVRETSGRYRAGAKILQIGQSL